MPSAWKTTGMHHVVFLALTDRVIQQNTFELMTSCSDIERMISGKSSVVRDAIDLVIVKAAETQKLLGRYKSLASEDPRTETKYQRLADNFTKVSAKIENAMRRYRDTQPLQTPYTGNQMSSFNPKNNFEKQSTYRPPSSYEYISSMEEGTRSHTLQDLQRINKEMSTLQDIYVSLSDASQSHTSLLDSVQSKVGEIGASASSAVQELKRANDRLDYWTRMKIYGVSGLAAVGIILWVI